MLDSLTRGEAALLRDARRWFARRANLASLESAARELLGVRVEVLSGRVGMFRLDRPLDHGVGVLMAPTADPSSGPILVVAERALAALVVARALRRETPDVIGGTPTWTPALGGAFGAVLFALVRRAHSSVALSVLHVGPSSALETERLRADPEIVRVALTVAIERDAFTLRLLVPRAQCLAAGPAEFSAEVLERLGPTPLSMPVVACVSRAVVSDVGELRPGDAFMPGAWRLSRSPRRELRGVAWLANPGSDSGIRVQLADEGHLVLAGGMDALTGAEDDMVESNEDHALVGAVGDVPVVVRVEIGEARMPARDWASLARGDVVALGHRLGDPVLLRVGGVAVARGELVDIEGEVGVRIRERIHGDRTEPF